MTGGGEDLSSVRQHNLLQRAVNGGAMDVEPERIISSSAQTNGRRFATDRPTAEGETRAEKLRRGNHSSQQPVGAQTSDDAVILQTGEDLKEALLRLSNEVAESRKEATAFRQMVEQVLKQLQEKDKVIEQLQAEVGGIRAQLQKQAEESELQLAHLRQAQYDLLTEQRAPQLAAIEKSVIVTLAGEPDADLRVAFGQLTMDHIAKLFGSDFKAQQIQHVDKFCPRPAAAEGQPRPPAPVWKQGNECARIEVHFKSLVDKQTVMMGATRRALQDKTHTMPSQCKKPKASFKVLIKDNLLGIELKEKAQLQESAMQHLIEDQTARLPEDQRVHFSWRRARITWFVAGATGNGGAWALLSHLDVPVGSTKQQVLRAARLAHQRAIAQAGARPDRRRHTAATGSTSATAAA